MTDTGQPGDSPCGGHQRLSLDRLKWWESLQYGMFIHFGMSTYVNLEGKVFFKPDGSDPPSCYAPDDLDVDQWISVARDAGMKYAILCAKHISGFCLWPSRHTDYTVAQSGHPTDVVEAFIDACERRGVLPGLYYSSYDNHHRFGSRTRSDFPSKQAFFDLFHRRPAFGGGGCGREDSPERLPYTTSLYQSFQTAQITELLTRYGSQIEFWIDHPDVLGTGYRTFLYRHITELQPDILVMMNNGTPSSEGYDFDYAWPSDLIAMEEGAREGTSHRKWRTIEGREFYLPGEVCDSIAPITRDWFYLDGDKPKAVEAIVGQFQACRAAGVNYLLNVPPDRRGRLPDAFVKCLMDVRRQTGV